MTMLAGLLIAAAVGGPAILHAQRDNAVWGAYTFGKAHALMRELEQTLKDTLTAFLRGDAPEISRQADLIVEQMGGMMDAFPESREGDAHLWSAAERISQHAGAMQSAANRGKYREAHQQYVKMANQCMQCHQARRVWGKFSTTGAPSQ